jgi:hypothetical protein
MCKKIFNLFDDNFSHDNYSVAGKDSNFISWDRNILDKSKPTFYSHNRIPDIQKGITSKKNSFGLLFESRGIIPEIYNQVEGYLKYFNMVFTHNSEFLSKYDNCFWIPGGGIWIEGTYGLGDKKIHTKNNLISIVSSKKNMCNLHHFRLGVVDFVIKNFNDKVDVYGLNSWVPIFNTLKTYMFSIVIENYQDDLYFTEKILNCFATGTIPIYLGAKKINEKFNQKGILNFNTIDELNEILLNIDDKFYFDRMDAVVENFELCKEFDNIEDYIYKNYFYEK